MDKETLLKELKRISDNFFTQQDFISAGQINRAMDCIEQLSDEEYSQTLRTKYKPTTNG